MTNRKFAGTKLGDLMGQPGAKASAKKRLAERYGLTQDAADKQVTRALAGESQRPEICTNILTVLGVDKSEHEDYLEPLPAGMPAETSVAGKSALSNAFTVRAETEPLHGGSLVELGEHGKVYLGGCRMFLTLANCGDDPVTVIGLRLSSKWQALDLGRYLRTDRPIGAGAVPHQLFIELSEKSFAGWWHLAEGIRTSEQRRRFDSTTADLLTDPDGSRVLFKIPPGETEWIQANVLPRESGLFAFELFVRVENARGDRAAKKTVETKVAKRNDDA